MEQNICKLVENYRGNVLNMFTTGTIVVVNSDKEILYSAGNVEKVAFARSSAKLMQAMVPISLGCAEKYQFTHQEVSQICASHSGESIHIETIQGILKKIGLDESYLKCGAHYPFKPEVELYMKENKIPPRDIHNNCSGKHTGMLAATKLQGESLADYYQVEHPHQQRILKMIAHICGYEAEKIFIGVDGCGVPVHAMPMEYFAYGMARMGDYKSLDSDLQTSAKLICASVMEHPLNTSGSDRIDYKIMSKYPGKIVVKSGADGYFAGAIPEKKIGFAIKVDDGNAKGRNAVLIEMLYQIGFIPEEDLAYFKEEHIPNEYNHRGEVVGYTKPCFQLTKYKLV